MANAIYPLYKQALMTASADVDIEAGDLKVALVDTGVYTYNTAHNFFDDITGVVGTPQSIANVLVSGANVDGDNVTFTAVSGNTVEALVFYIDTGSAATSRLVAYIDTGQTGLPVTPNGGDITITWDVAGIFDL